MKKIKLIAETAWHHDGEFSFMEHLLDTILNQSKADVVKMHVTLDFDEYMDSSHSIYNDLKGKLFSLKPCFIFTMNHLSTHAEVN